MINFDPAQGRELNARHPAVVISLDSIGALPLRIVVPITSHFGKDWLIELLPNATNGLTKVCSADAFQCKSISNDRFLFRMGAASESELEDILDAVAMCIGI